ncbi:hypothetical protein [Phenylobacterium sp.]|jgi:hypothetical protein|uniref:hypothetical protein n=1 Tax=Phenylobacterium sp. TaxID=1871053 RepID=UPI002F418213
MRFIANDIPGLRLELERAFDSLNNPRQPTPLWPVAAADLPPDTARWKNCTLWVEDLNVAAVSDGADWIRLDTGAPI